ncbi:hypothetical protein OGAPHI_001293 [Ogataea philodendri]|uniref:Uncharacterized protein n=1 Tax=Ogataea philodendri TaxID=1378263 RepID=A0A9P8PF89_9ASCO|nr:uncharacterized protein OGAPHI_001293 [Ogataea philodendri]KAH3670777.1 hypothetical protein OGAPHI_001293 [Ogataea philodendri]
MMSGYSNQRFCALDVLLKLGELVGFSVLDVKFILLVLLAVFNGDVGPRFDGIVVDVLESFLEVNEDDESEDLVRFVAAVRVKLEGIADSSKVFLVTLLGIVDCGTSLLELFTGAVPLAFTSQLSKYSSIFLLLRESTPSR